jgi:hypothetical protein
MSVVAWTRRHAIQRALATPFTQFVIPEGVVSFRLTILSLVIELKSVRVVETRRLRMANSVCQR